MFQDWFGLKSDLVLAGEQLGELNSSSYLGSCIPPDDHILDELSSHIQKLGWHLLILRHLWCQRDIRLSIEVYIASVRWLFLYGSGTWSLRADDMRRLFSV